MVVVQYISVRNDVPLEREINVKRKRRTVKTEDNGNDENVNEKREDDLNSGSADNDESAISKNSPSISKRQR